MPRFKTFRPLKAIKFGMLLRPFNARHVECTIGHATYLGLGNLGGLRRPRGLNIILVPSSLDPLIMEINGLNRGQGKERILFCGRCPLLQI